MNASWYAHTMKHTGNHRERIPGNSRLCTYHESVSNKFPVCALPEWLMKKAVGMQASLQALGIRDVIYRYTQPLRLLADRRYSTFGPPAPASHFARRSLPLSVSLARSMTHAERVYRNERIINAVKCIASCPEPEPDQRPADAQPCRLHCARWPSQRANS